jgi:hypothetical protein
MSGGRKVQIHRTPAPPFYFGAHVTGPPRQGGSLKVANE